MKTIISILALVSGTAAADQYVNPYIRQDGTYVQGYMRSSPNSSTLDNYSTRSNTNPYTGERGYSNPSSSYGSSYNNQLDSNSNSLSSPYGYGRRY